MHRLTLALAAVPAALALAVAAADPPRVATADPQEASEGPAGFAFDTQGEYEGTLTDAAGGEKKAGIQVVAGGPAKFRGRLFLGGLPGAGAERTKPDYEFAGRSAAAKLSLGAPDLTVLGNSELVRVKVAGTAPAAGDFNRVERPSPTAAAAPPNGSIVLFAKPGDEANWAGGKLAKLSDGEFLAAGGKSKQAFGAFTAHVEFRTPWMPDARGQARGNSGVYCQDRYEVQILDSFGLAGDATACGAVYTLHKPAVHMAYPPVAWQTYDIDLTPAAFDTTGKKSANARLTLKHNGVVVHDNVELRTATPGGQPEAPTPGPIHLQDHGDPVVFRNIWVVPR